MLVQSYFPGYSKFGQKNELFSSCGPKAYIHNIYIVKSQSTERG